MNTKYKLANRQSDKRYIMVWFSSTRVIVHAVQSVGDIGAECQTLLNMKPDDKFHAVVTRFRRKRGSDLPGVFITVGPEHAHGQFPCIIYKASDETGHVCIDMTDEEISVILNSSPDKK